MIMKERATLLATRISSLNDNLCFRLLLVPGAAELEIVAWRAKSLELSKTAADKKLLDEMINSEN